MDCRITRYLFPSLGGLLFSVILLFLFFGSDHALLGDGDTGYHIRAGEYILRTLSIPSHDIFSYRTPPLPWTAHEWLSEVVMALVHGRFGLSGIVALFSLLLAGTTSFLFLILRSQGGNILWSAAITLLAFAASQIHWLARPHAFSFLLMLVWQHLLDVWHRGGRDRLYLLPLSMLLWVNLHGGFLGGFLLLGAYLGGNLWDLALGPPARRDCSRHRLGRLFLTTAACLVASLCNPNGWRILLFPFRLVSDSYLMDHVAEFLSPNFHEVMPFKYLLLLLIALCAVSRRRLEPVEVVLVLLFTNMALYSARYIPLFALVIASVLARQAQRIPVRGQAPLARFLRARADLMAKLDSGSRGFLWPATAVFLVITAVVTGRSHHGFDPTIKPVAAAEFLMRQRISGHMFNDDEFGDYLIYRGFPEYRVFFDGRSDMYGAEGVREYCRVTNLEPGWEQVLDKYQVTWIFYGTKSHLCRQLLSSKRWIPVYSDPVASILVRDLPQYRYLTQKHPSY